MKRFVEFKHQKDEKLFFNIKPLLLMMFLDGADYCNQHGYDVIVTRTVDEKIQGVSVSETHAEGRAIDQRSRNMPEWFVVDLVNYINKKYAEKYGTGPAGKPPKVLIYHKGTSYHLHWQIKRL